MSRGENELVIDVQSITDDSEQVLRVDVQDNVVGFRFKALLSRKICFILDSLYCLLKLNLSDEETVLESKFGQQKTGNEFLKKEKGFFRLTEDIFEDVLSMEDSRRICNKLRLKLDALYGIFDELLVLVGDSQETNVYGLSDNEIIGDYRDFHNEMKHNGEFMTEIGILIILLHILSIK